MRTIARRLTRVEERFHPAANNEHLRRLRLRLEAAKQRMAEYGQSIWETRKFDGLGWTIAERLRLGRARVFRIGLKRDAVSNLNVQANPISAS